LGGQSGRAKTIDEAALTSPLYEEIGLLKVELDWLKKKSSPRKLLSQYQPNFAELILGWPPS
jgi:hypothetical protein